MASLKKRVSLKDIASRANVSPSLVSFVLNGKAKEHRINAKAAEKIKQIAKDMGYKPNIAAKSLRDGKSRGIGVVVSDISNPFFSAIARHIEAAAEKMDYTVQFSSSDESAKRTESLVASMLSRNIDGLILVPSEGSEQSIKDLMESGIPLVLLDRRFPEIPVSYVCLNNLQAAYDATMHLIHEGFTRIGIIAYDVNLPHMKDRIEGYRKAMTDAGLGANIQIRYTNHKSLHKQCVKGINALLEGGADAVLFASNSIAAESLTYLIEKKVNIPKELGVVTFDGGTAFEFYSSPFTYIQQPLEVMAQKATDILLEQIEGKCNMTQQIEVSGSLIVRASSLGPKNW